MMALYFTILLLTCGIGVHADENTLEVGSGDLDAQTTAVPSVNLIDGNGDIVTGIRTNPPDDLKNFTSHEDIGSATEVVDLNSEENQRIESSTLKADITMDGEITVIQSQFSTTTTMVVTSETTPQPTEVPTTETSTKSDLTPTTTAATMTTTTAMPTTTDTSTTSTEIPTTAFEATTISSEKKQTTMTNSKQSTTTSSTTAAKEKSDKPTGHSAQTQAEGENEVCIFISADFKCFEEQVVCFGEGEIDCSGGEDSVSSPSSKSEDYSEDEEPESATIGTFPPNLVGVGTPKKISFYNRQSLTTEGTNETAEKDVHENSEMNITTTEIVEDLSNTATKMVEGVNNATTETPVTTEDAFTVVTTANANNTETVLEMKETTPAGESDSTTIFETTEEVTVLPTTASILLLDTDAITNANYTEETTTPEDSDASAATSEKPAQDSGVIRRRRGISHEGHTPEPHYEELYKKKTDNRDKMRNETCRLYGNIHCLPVPTLRNCVGKTFCQAVRIKSEVPSPSKSKGLEIWMIVVIVICGLFGFTTIGMVIYLIIHSFSRRCKKLKVQPAHDVLPLNYITKKSETAETA